MPLPPIQNQGDNNFQPTSPGIAPQPAPFQDMQTPQSPQQQPMQSANPINNTSSLAPQPMTGNSFGGVAPKKSIKGPFIILIVVILIFGGASAAAVLTSKPSNKQKTAPAQQQLQSAGTSSTDVTQDDSPEQPYKFIDDQQRSNLQNLQTSITTYQSQNTKKQLPPATPRGWSALKASNIIDPVTNKPYAFSTNKMPNIGEVQYLLQSVCASDNTIIPSTDTGSFALRMHLYNGTYACVDSSNASN